MALLNNPFRTTRLSAKLARREGFLSVPSLAHWCPACEEMHDFAVEHPLHNGSIWRFAGPHDLPTFSPSMNIAIGDPVAERCHYILTAGVINFCGDSTHSLAGQSVPLPDIPREVWMRAGITS